MRHRSLIPLFFLFSLLLIVETDAENAVKAVCHGIIAGWILRLLHVNTNRCSLFILNDENLGSIILGLPVPFKLPNPDGCVDSNLACPLTKGTSYKYIASFPVLKSYPKVKVDVKYELKNGAGEEIACVIIPVKIQ